MVMSSGPFLSPLPLPFLPFLAIFAPVGSDDGDDDGEVRDSGGHLLLEAALALCLRTWVSR